MREELFRPELCGDQTPEILRGTLKSPTSRVFPPSKHSAPARFNNRLRKVACVAAPCLAPKSLRHPLPYLLDEALMGAYGLRGRIVGTGKSFLDEALYKCA